MLIEGRIAPGAKLNERELCEQLGVSRTPLREAIKLLAAEGLADLLPNRGAIAVKLSEADVMHAFEVLAGIEGLSGELAAQRITDQEFAEIRADRKSTRLNSSHANISYAVFCLKKKKNGKRTRSITASDIITESETAHIGK